MAPSDGSGSARSAAKKRLTRGHCMESPQHVRGRRTRVSRGEKSRWSPRYSLRWHERMEKDLFPWTGSLGLAAVTAPLLLQVLRRIEALGSHETAHNLRQTAGQVFRYGVATGRCERNPAPDLHGALSPVIVIHMSPVLDPDAAGALMRSFMADGRWTSSESNATRRAKSARVCFFCASR
jgi:hypothetical protein